MGVFMNGLVCFSLPVCCCMSEGRQRESSGLSQPVQSSLCLSCVSFSTGMPVFLCSAKVLFNEAFLKVQQRVVP